MHDESWVPAGLEESESADYLELRPDVPEWMWRPMLDWLYSNLTFMKSRGINLPRARVTVPDLQLIASRARVKLSSSPETLVKSLNSLSGRQIIMLTSTILHMGEHSRDSSAIVQLRAVLKASRSIWTVRETNGAFDLSRVIPEGVQLELERTIDDAGTAGSILARGWNSLYGIEPRPSAAYADAVKAVEIAAHHVVEPNNKSATLGTMNSRLTDPNVAVSTVLRDKPKFHQQETIVRMIDLLWYGHEDRHGTRDYSDVTVDQAKAGLSIATMLVSLFTNGSITVGRAEKS